MFCTFNDQIRPPPDVTVPELLDEPVNCPSVDTNSITFIASKVDCNRYYICYHGTPVRQQCISEMHWNPTILKCDKPENSKCQVNNFNSCTLYSMKFRNFIFIGQTVSTNLSTERSSIFPASRNV